MTLHLHFNFVIPSDPVWTYDTLLPTYRDAAFGIIGKQSKSKPTASLVWSLMIDALQIPWTQSDMQI